MIYMYLLIFRNVDEVTHTKKQGHHESLNLTVFEQNVSNKYLASELMYNVLCAYLFLPQVFAKTAQVPTVKLVICRIQ